VAPYARKYRFSPHMLAITNSLHRSRVSIRRACFSRLSRSPSRDRIERKAKQRLSTCLTNQEKLCTKAFFENEKTHSLNERFCHYVTRLASVYRALRQFVSVPVYDGTSKSKRDANYTCNSRRRVIQHTGCIYYFPRG